MADQWQDATSAALSEARDLVLASADAASQAIVQADRPSSVVRAIGGVDGAPDTAFRLVQLAELTQTVAAGASSVISYRYQYMTEIVAFALATLRELSPVGAAGDKHPGLYRDSHMVFVDGHSATLDDVAAWRPGQQINLSNPVPYARKIEIGHMVLSVPGHIYERAAEAVAARYGNQAAIRFVFMPVNFGDRTAFKDFSRRVNGRRVSGRGYRDWQMRQPAIEIKAR